MESSAIISVRLADRTGLEDVRKAAWVASHRKVALEIVVDYRPPPVRTLVSWRSAAPPELRWRVTGSVSADALAAEADAVAKREGAAPAVRVEQLPRRRCRGRGGSARLTTRRDGR